MAEMTETEFWDRLKRHFLAIAWLIENRYADKEVIDAGMATTPKR